MLKYQLDSIEDLDESVQGLYTEKDGKYVLGIEGLPPSEDVDGLKKKVDELLTEKKEAAKRAKDAEDAARKAAEDAARKSGDTEALEKSWQDKLTKREGELQAELQAIQSSVTAMTVDSVAAKMASELALPGSAELLIPHIKTRLAAEQREGGFVTVVRDKDGKPSAFTVDDLKNEFASNPAFAPVIVGSKATGGGASGGNGGGAVTKKFDQMTGAELSALRKESPDQYARLKSEYDQPR